LLIVVILEGALLPTTAIGTLFYTQAAGQKVNGGPLAKGQQHKFCFGLEEVKEEGGRPVMHQFA
jgi:hypothetical protein